MQKYMRSILYALIGMAISIYAIATNTQGLHTVGMIIMLIGAILSIYTTYRGKK
ncbi:MAG: hypothetical protein SPL05_02485 [Eubacteriales bacterium]|nr:hypothetical protein [Eubacteriales bacterium]